jgi:hypothetical protein
LIVPGYNPDSDPKRDCATNVDGATREWDYGSGGLQIEESNFRQNRVGGRDLISGEHDETQGDALYVQNLNATITSCSFVANRAGSAGAVYLEAGSTCLALLGIDGAARKHCRRVWFGHLLGEQW